MRSKPKYHRAPSLSADIILDENAVQYARGADIEDLKAIMPIARDMSRAIIRGGFRGDHPNAYAIAHQQVANPHQRFFVVHPNLGQHFRGSEVIVAPTFTPTEGSARELKREFCLTHPGRHAKPVQRWASIEASWLDLDGNIQRATMTGLIAQIFQHETDHTNGMTIWRTK